MSSVQELTLVFVCYNALSFEASVRIAELKRKENPQSSCLFLLLLRAPRSRLPEGARVWELDPPLHTASRWAKPFRLARWFRRVLDEAEREHPGRWRIYIPHPVELPGNHFFFFGREGDEIELLPDGLINYFPRTMQPEVWWQAPRYGLRLFLEHLAAWRWRFRYRSVWAGHQTQYELGRYQRSWTFNPEGFLTVSGELQQLPALAQTAQTEALPARGAVLFLDQELHEIVTPSLERELREEVLQLLRERQPAHLFYKAHPRGKNRAPWLRQLGVQFTDCSGEENAERWLSKQPVELLLGFYSTSLVLLSSREVRERIAVLPDPQAPGVRRPCLLEQIVQPLQRSGVRIRIAGRAGKH